MSHSFFSDSNEVLSAGSRETTDPPRIQRHFRPATLNLVRPSSARGVDSYSLNSHCEMPFDISQIHRDLLRKRQEASRIQCGGISAAHWWCWRFSSSQMKGCNTRTCSDAYCDREALSFCERDVDAGKRRLKRTRHDLSGISTDHADSRFRGLPPLAPLALAAAAFALDRRRPPRRPVEAANKR